MDINSILPGDSIPTNGGSPDARGIPPAKQTAQKVSQFPLPVDHQKAGLRSAPMTPLQEAVALAKKIEKRWDDLAPEPLAEAIIEVEKRVSLLTETGPEVEKVKKQLENLHFDFVFPLNRELKLKVRYSFAKTVLRLADAMLNGKSLQESQESVGEFYHDYNRTQQWEVTTRESIAPEGRF